MTLFKQSCRFIAGAASLDHLPNPHFPEVAFIGRSNVGKSSLINALVGQKALARTSVTPGRTQEINFFLLAERLMLVDLPGYGYARAPKKHVDAWNALVRDYLRGRANLKRACVLIDARRGIMDVDEEMFELLDEAAVATQVVLTKADSLTKDAVEKLVAATEARLKKHPAALPKVISTSALKRLDIDHLQAAIEQAL